MSSSTQSGTERSRLLQHVIYQQFGAAVGEIASILLFRGSLSFPQLARLTSLPPSLVHASLLILSTHCLLFHSETEVAGRLTELYELNHDAIERRMRGGMYAEMAHEWRQGGPQLAQVVEVLWREGMLRREDLYEVVRAQFALERGLPFALDDAAATDPKGKRKQQEAIDDAERLVNKAFAQGYIQIVTPGSQLSPSSLEIKWEEELKALIKGIPMTKDLKNVKDKLRDKQISWAEEERARAKGKVRLDRLAQDVGSADSYIRHSQGIDAVQADEEEDDAPKRKKRKKGGAASPSKKSRKGRNDDDSDVEQPGSDDDDMPSHVDRPLPEEMFYRINEERFHLRWRAQLLRSFAADLYNPQVAAVLGIILDIVTTRTDSMSEPRSSPISLHEINTYYDRLADKPDLSHTLAKHKSDHSWPPKRERAGDFILATCEVLSGLDRWGLSTQETFLQQQGESTHAKWVVDWSSLGKAMKRSLVEAIIRDKLGEKAIRCWRILEAKGKLEEKHLARLAFLPVKEAREILSHLSASGLIEPQEVPRSADRAPSRTIYLWFVDFNKVVTSLVHHHYKALANLQAQRAYQLEQRRGLVDKRERSDVRADPTLLSARDNAAIVELDKVLEAIAVAEQRVDEQLFVLREFDPDPEVV
ncbi:hypothetical protein BMF94_4876 [Rhodotorula taiwanensis]|uniref:DNA-directed RNA polymerase III subunit RPC3 n=1 Tax=Rhodotorula taiwanensis TaxID=741276 RepID=A0A2S5B5S9_9BASI|nr:hypothetical protein BMF94_4876 [Rhodotorula taiwanensis]